MLTDRSARRVKYPAAELWACHSLKTLFSNGTLQAAITYETSQSKQEKGRTHSFRASVFLALPPFPRFRAGALNGNPLRRIRAERSRSIGDPVGDVAIP